MKLHLFLDIFQDCKDFPRKLLPDCFIINTWSLFSIPWNFHEKSTKVIKVLWTTTNSLPLFAPWRSRAFSNWIQISSVAQTGEAFKAWAWLAQAAKKEPPWSNPIHVKNTGRNQRNKTGLPAKLRETTRRNVIKHPKHLAEVSWSIVNHISCVYIFQTAKLEYSNDLHPSDNLSKLVIRWDCRHFSCDIAMFTKARGYWGWHLMVHLASKRSNAWGP